MFAGLANAVTKHSKAVIVLWIVIVLCSLPLGLKVGGVLEYNLTDMASSDSESSEGSDIMDYPEFEKKAAHDCAALVMEMM